MIELLESGAGSKWDNDFKSMNINVGSVPSVEGKPVIILDSLMQGVDPKYQADWTNTGIIIVYVNPAL